MVQKLIRVLDEPVRHKVLDLIFLGAFGLGLINAINCVRAIGSGQYHAGMILLLVQMALFCFAGLVGYIAHLKGLVWFEFGTLIPVIAGYAVIVLGSLGTLTSGTITNPFVLSMGGLVPAVGIWMIIDAAQRFYVINVRRKQIKKSQAVRLEAETIPDTKALKQQLEEKKKSEA